MRDSVHAELKNAINEMGVSHRFKCTVNPMRIKCDTGTQVLFRGLDKVEKVKSVRPSKGAITDIWVEEATEANENDIDQLRKRQRGGDKDVPKRLILSFNPIYQTHWIYTRYFSTIGWGDEQTQHSGKSLTILKTTYKDNGFLTDGDIYDLENEPDQYMYEVYTLGKWGVLGDVVFKNWRIVDLSDMRNQFTNLRDGLDFGYGAHPAAYVGMHIDTKRKRLYIYDELYLYGHTNQELATKLSPLVGKRRVVADSAEPKSIRELNTENVRAIGAKKGKDSVNFGIQWLQGYEIVVDKSCVNAQNEFRLYQWAKDRHGNKIKSAD